MTHQKKGMMAVACCLLTMLVAVACGGGESPALPEARALVDEYEGVVEKHLTEMKILKTSNDKAGFLRVSRELNGKMQDYTAKWKTVSKKLKPQEVEQLADRLNALNGRIIASLTS